MRLGASARKRTLHVRANISLGAQQNRIQRFLEPHRHRGPPVRKLPRALFPRFLEHVPGTNYSVTNHTKWKYEDHVPGVVKNRIVPWRVYRPHMVLRDATGKPRVVLSYAIESDAIEITAIQRERTEYDALTVPSLTPGGGGLELHFEWNAKRENESSKAFQSQLGGMHSSEFLLSYFIFQHRRAIREGKRVIFYAPRDSIHNCKGLLERFFGKELDSNSFGTHYLLNTQRRRVKEILAIP